MVADINGQELKDGDLVQVLCEVVGMDEDGVRVRILNSEQELLISLEQDEVLGLHASSELMKVQLPHHPEAEREASELGLGQRG